MKKIIFFMAFLLVVIAIFGSNLDIKMDLNKTFLPPSINHLLGTNNLGQDEFKRLIIATSNSLRATFLTLFLILILAIFVGSISGLFEGVIDRIIVLICDIFLSIPTTILALFLIFILGSGAKNLILSIVLTHWAFYAKVIRSLVIDLKNKNYVIYTFTTGADKFVNFKRNFLKPVLLEILFLASLNLSNVMLHFCSLSFLGIGLNKPELGVMINEAREFIFSDPQFVIYPGAMLLFCTITFNLCASYLKEYYERKKVSY